MWPGLQICFLSLCLSCLLPCPANGGQLKSTLPRLLGHQKANPSREGFDGQKVGSSPSDTLTLLRPRTLPSGNGGAKLIYTPTKKLRLKQVPWFLKERSWKEAKITEYAGKQEGLVTDINTITTCHIFRRLFIEVLPRCHKENASSTQHAQDLQGSATHVWCMPTS
ncbi:hypothetical protein LEMLEM_LOCUS24600 [Lemmus lemmus]